MSETRIVRVAILVPANVRSKYISELLGFAFRGEDDILQFVVEGAGSSDIAEVTEATLMDALIDGTAEELVAEE